MQSCYFVYWTYIKKRWEWGPVYIDKIFRGHPPSPSQLKQVFIWKTVEPFAQAQSWKQRSRMVWFCRPDRVDPA